MTTDEPTRPPAEEWDGMLASKPKMFVSMNPLTPCMLTPYNTPYCNLSSLKQRLSQSQPDTIVSTSQHHAANGTTTQESSSLPPSLRTQPTTPSQYARAAFLLLVFCITAPITLVLLCLCGPLFFLVALLASPIWGPLLFLLWFFAKKTPHTASSAPSSRRSSPRTSP
ncbi:Aste57867_14021 [Aphanomyces stellatus]|uniref:Aste57867_14021 protein n=1 Tax=Aphanomyces stellatus TaxID=120398 RepID=A0A485L0F5_9STRA|nr:hypothetical protein As57867_013970 [Aphanomyces stellatus]VFT90851.1 Aste57867_14021 [Aphanomyces stellatus]